MRLFTLFFLAVVGCSSAGSSHLPDTPTPNTPTTENTVNLTPPTQCLGFLESSDWIADRSHLATFALVDTVSDLDRPSSQWRITCESWCTEPALLRRFHDSVDVESVTRGHLTIDPTRYVALSFDGHTFYVMEVASIAPGRAGKAIFADAHAPLSDDFAAVIAEAHSLPEFTVP